MTVEHVLPNKVDTKCALMKVFILNDHKDT